MKQKNLSRRQARWQEFMGQYDFDISYIPGEENEAADAPSRLPPDLEPELIVAATSGTLRIASDPSWLAAIRNGYEKDSWCKKIRDNKIIGFREENGLLYVGDRLVIPRVKDVREHAKGDGGHVCADLRRVSVKQGLDNQANGPTAPTSSARRPREVCSY